MTILFKKNPAVDGNVCVQKQLFENDTVVYGDEFKAFIEPMVPGGTPLLVIVSANDLTPSQKASLEYYAANRTTPPPRHLGPNTSNFMKDVQDGSFVVASTGSRNERDEKPVAENTGKTESENTEVAKTDLVIEEEKAERLLSKAEMVESLPGITGRNVDKFESIVGNSPEKIASASNADLKRAGIGQPFFKRIRDAARKLV